MRVTALDDDTAQLELIVSLVKAVGHDCHAFRNAEDFMRNFSRETYDLVILDWMLREGGSGVEVAKWIRRSQRSAVPILFVTGRAEEEDIVEGLASGADDYVLKPVRVGEVMARIRALLRRAYQDGAAREYNWGDFRFDAATHTVHRTGQDIVLKQKEFELGLILFRNSGRLLSRSYLLEVVWGIKGAVASRTLDTHISRIRAKLSLRADSGYRLTSVYSYGYRLERLEDNREGA